MAKKFTRQELKESYLKYWKKQKDLGVPPTLIFSWSEWLKQLEKEQGIKLPPRKIKKRTIKSLYIRPKTEKALKELRRRRLRRKK